MRYYKNNKAHTFCNILVVISIVLAISLINFHRQLDKHVDQICKYKGKETVNNIIENVIYEQLEGSTEQYITIIRNNSNEILSIESNTNDINKLQNSLKKSINNELADINNNRMSLPIGTLTGITLFSGIGPEVVLKLHQVGAVETAIKSEFVSAGINQTKHKLLIEIIVELSAILPTHSTSIVLKDEYLISETIIVGQIPEAYLNSNKI